MSWPTAILTSLTLFLGEAGCLARASIIIADSASEYSGVQGQDNWYYGYYAGTFTPASFRPMSNFADIGIYGSNGPSWFVDYSSPSPFVYTSLFATGGHPNGIITTAGRDQVEHWAVRRYISEVGGPVLLSGNIADAGPGGGNGIVGRIFVDGAEVYSAVVQANNFNGVDYSFWVDVSAGSVVDFAIDPRDRADPFDTTRFTARVSAVPEPSSLALMSLCLAAGLGRHLLIRARSARPGPDSRA